ncbi:MAG: MFS transporter [Coriobacteriales bacterium]|jgi:Na+/melibiose symporter-like transporter|nr:MFS transporter [Coriobacteriales bacterium]
MAQDSQAVETAKGSTTGSNKRVSNFFVNIFGLGDFGFQIMVNMELLFFMAFLTDAVQFDPGTAGLIGAITGVFDILWVFIAGMIIQKCNFRWGKLRSWLLLTPLFIWATFVFQFWGLSGNGSLASLLICLGFIVSHLIWNCAYTAHISMISAYSDDIQQRATMSSRRMLGQALGKIVFSLVAVSLIGFFSGPDKLPIGYTIATAVLTLPMVVCYFVIFVVSKPYEKTQAPGGAGAQATAEKVPVWKSVANAARNSQLIVLLIADFGRCFAFYLVTAVTAYYFRVVLGDPGAMTLYLLLINVAAAIGALAAPYVTRAIGKKNTYFLGMVGYAACLLLVFLLPSDYMTFMIIMVIASAILQLSFSMGTAMFADTVIYGEHKTGVNSRGFIMGLYSLPIKTSVVARASFIGVMLAAMNYVPDAVTPQMVDGIKSLFTVYPAIALIICALFGYLLYRLTDKRVTQLSDELAERKNAANQATE